LPEEAYLNFAMLLAYRHLSGANDVDFLGLAFADRHGEAAADDVAEDVVEDKVEILGVSALFFKEVDGGDDAATGTADPRLGSAGLDAFDIAVTDLQDIFQLQVLNRPFFPHQVHHGILRLGVQDQAGRVGLGVATDDHHLLAEVGQAGHGVLGGGGLADAAFAVDCDLTKFFSAMTLFLSQLGCVADGCSVFPRGGIPVDVSGPARGSVRIPNKKAPPGLSGWGLLARAAPPWHRKLLVEINSLNI
jgi:hypothetical protein